MLADELDYVLGVDTHRDEHVLAVVTARTGPRSLTSPFYCRNSASRFR
jgi:hypothetical protein